MGGSLKQGHYDPPAGPSNRTRENIGKREANTQNESRKERYTRGGGSLAAEVPRRLRIYRPRREEFEGVRLLVGIQ